MSRKSGKSRSSCPEVFYKIGVFKKFAKLIGKHLCQSLFFNKVAFLSLRLYERRDCGTDVFTWNGNQRAFWRKLVFFSHLKSTTKHTKTSHLIWIPNRFLYDELIYFLLVNTCFPKFFEITLCKTTVKVL